MLKSLISFTLFALAFSAQAGQKYTQWPTVQGVAINQLCDAGATFQTTVPQKVCLRADVTTGHNDTYVGNEVTCLEYGMANRAVSKTYATSTCDQPNVAGEAPLYPYPCKQVVGSKSYANTFKVSVMEDRGELGSFEASVFTYVIPACQK